MTVKEIKSKGQFDELKASGKTIFVNFYADWCGPCRMISPEFEKLAEKHMQEGGAAEFYKVDIDVVQDLAQELGIRSIPTFHVYKDGKQLGSPVVGVDTEGLGGLTTFIEKYAA